MFHATKSSANPEPLRDKMDEQKRKKSDEEAEIIVDILSEDDEIKIFTDEADADQSVIPLTEDKLGLLEGTDECPSPRPEKPRGGGNVRGPPQHGSNPPTSAINYVSLPHQPYLLPPPLMNEGIVRPAPLMFGMTMLHSSEQIEHHHQQQQQQQHVGAFNRHIDGPGVNVSQQQQQNHTIVRPTAMNFNNILPQLAGWMNNMPRASIMQSFHNIYPTSSLATTSDIRFHQPYLKPDSDNNNIHVSAPPPNINWSTAPGISLMGRHTADGQQLHLPNMLAGGSAIRPNFLQQQNPYDQSAIQAMLLANISAAGGFKSPGQNPENYLLDNSNCEEVWKLAKEDRKPHVKKPLNAFMLFMREHRNKVVNESSLKESAAINQILGRKWHALSHQEQAKYYDMAKQERIKHMELHPGWSARDNYGLRKRRKKRREKTTTNNDNPEQARKCRARYGVERVELWCKTCRRKKKCMRFQSDDDTADSILGLGGAGKRESREDLTDMDGVFGTDYFEVDECEFLANKSPTLLDIKSDDENSSDVVRQHKRDSSSPDGSSDTEGNESGAKAMKLHPDDANVHERKDESKPS